LVETQEIEEKERRPSGPGARRNALRLARMAPARDPNPINSNIIQNKGYEILSRKRYFFEANSKVLKQDFKCGNTS
jgi:hypothetical protein